MKVIDIHTHVIPRRGFLRPNGETVATAAELVQIMDRCGIDRMVALPLTSPEALHFVQSNEEVFEACDQFPGRFIKFCNVDPRIENNSPEHDFVPILEYYKGLGAKGLGELVANLWWDDPRVHQLLLGCQEVGFPVIFHVAMREFRTYGLISEPGLGGLERALVEIPAAPICRPFAGVLVGGRAGERSGARRLSEGESPSRRRRPAPAAPLSEPLVRPLRRQRLQRRQPRPGVGIPVPRGIPGPALLRPRHLRAERPRRRWWISCATPSPPARSPAPRTRRSWAETRRRLLKLEE